MKSYLIYCLKEPDTGEIRYFGKTCQKMYSRLSAHKASKTNYHVSRWVRQLVSAGKSPVCEVLIKGLTLEESCEEEKALIQWGRKKGFRLTNITAGGDGCLGFRWSPQMKEKFRQDKLGSKNPMWGKPRPERTLSPTTIEKLREIQTGKKLSEETKRKVSIASQAYWNKRKASEALQTIGGQ